jgi:5'-3' exonuclease
MEEKFSLSKAFKSYKKERTENGGISLSPPVLIIDMMALFKMHFFGNDTTTNGGTLIGGSVGVLNAIPSLVKRFNANSVYCIFDGEKNSEKRRMIYEDYKKGRGNKNKNIRSIHLTASQLDENEKVQMTSMVEVIKGLPVHIISIKGLEADDVIGYLCKKFFSEDDSKRIIVSSDKDFVQLIDEKTSLYNIRKKEIINIHNVNKLWDIPRENILYLRCVEGDSSDAITGVKGVKFKTLVKIFPEIQTTKFESIDHFCESIQEKKSELSSSTAGKSLLSSEKIIRRNFRLMQLHSPEMPTFSEMKILDLAREPLSDIMNFYSVERFIQHNRITDLINVTALRNLFKVLIK